MFLAHLAYGISEPLDCHTLRFDFRGNASSSGEFLFGGNARELEDLRCIIRFIRQTMLCDVLCVLGHSKAVYTVLKVAAAQEETQRDGVPGIPCFINMSGRYAVPHNFDPSRSMTPDQMKTLRETGRVVLMTRGHRTNEITTADVEERNRQDSSFVGGIRSSRVLTIHGEKDATIGVADNARKYEEVMGKDNQNHTLRIVKGADHNYNGLRHMKELVSIVTEFLS